MASENAVRSEPAERSGGDRSLRVGDQCYIRPSTRYPKFSFLPGVITGGLEMRDVYDDEGEKVGQREAYKVKVQGEEVCAPPSMLVKQERST